MKKNSTTLDHLFSAISVCAGIIFFSCGCTILSIFRNYASITFVKRGKRFKHKLIIKERSIMTGLSVFDTTVQKSLEIIDAVKAETNIDDRHKAFEAFKTTMHVLRDRLPVNEAVHVSAQLPAIITGFYFEGWKPASTPTKFRNREDFLNRVREQLQNVDPALDAEHVVQGVFRVLSMKISSGEIEDILKILPEELQELWPTAEL